jgi:hypothetical protein
MDREAGWKKSMSAPPQPEGEALQARMALSGTIRGALILLALVLLTLAPGPQAWADAHPTGTVGRANLDGGGDPAGGVGSRWRRIGR